MLFGEKITLLVIGSNKDLASENIKHKLLNLSEWNEIDLLYENPVYQNKSINNIIMINLNDRKIFHENIEKEVKNKLGIIPDQVIFISKHNSKTGNPTLTVHPIGNYGKAEFGGKSYTLCNSSPRLMTYLLRLIKNKATKEKLYHEVCFEVTHHGPFMKTPSLFIEVGSNSDEWKKEKPAKVIAECLMNTFKDYLHEKDMPNDIPVLLGIGGGHYAPRFTDVVLKKKVAFGHMLPKYHINAGNISPEIIKKALDTTPNVQGVYFHRKSLKKSQITEFKSWLKEFDIPSFSSKEFENL